METSANVMKSAILSRCVVLLFQFLFNVFVDDHIADAFRSPFIEQEYKSGRWTTADNVLHVVLEGFTRWDSQYFLHIAQFGYTYEHMAAFFPAYPWLCGVVAQAFQGVFGTALFSPAICALLSGVLVSNVSFVLSAYALFCLTQAIFKNRRISFEVVRLYCFNPASIFFSSCYTESLFAFFSFTGMYFLEMHYNTIATIMFAFGSFTRSNSVFLIIFYAHRIICNYKRGKHYFCLSVQAVFSCLGYLIVQLYFWDDFCFPHEVRKFALPNITVEYGRQMGYKSIGSNQGVPDWCFYSLPLPYSYVQSKYWNVGLLSYWQLKQLPNFVLAFPVIIIVTNFCRKRFNDFPDYCLHALLLALLCVFFSNVQVATRLLMSASPIPIWGAAHSKRNHLVWMYFLSYFIFGIFFHSNFYPWT